MEEELCSGYYKPEENKTCDECGVVIGDYTIYKRVTRCVGCWIIFDANLDNDIYAVPRLQNQQG